MSAGEQWTDEAIRRESERWVHVPSDGVCTEDERRLLVHLPRRWGQSRVWRSSAPDEERADELIQETIGAVRAASCWRSPVGRPDHRDPGPGIGGAAAVPKGWQRDEYRTGADKALLDLGVVHGFLARSSYWSRGAPFRLLGSRRAQGVG